MEFRNYLLRALAAADRQAILPYLVEVSLERGQTLFEPGDPVEQVFFPSNAVLSIATVMRDGRTLESSTIGHESATPQLWALSDGHGRARTFAQIGGAAIRISASILRARATKSPALMTQDRTGNRSLPLTQEYMSVMTGVQRTTMSAVANQLREAGFIRYSRGNVEILNRPGLEAFACECYQTIRSEFDDLQA